MQNNLLSRQSLWRMSIVVFCSTWLGIEQQECRLVCGVFFQRSPCPTFVLHLSVSCPPRHVRFYAYPLLVSVRVSVRCLAVCCVYASYTAYVARQHTPLVPCCAPRLLYRQLCMSQPVLPAGERKIPQSG